MLAACLVVLSASSAMMPCVFNITYLHFFQRSNNSLRGALADDWKMAWAGSNLISGYDIFDRSRRLKAVPWGEAN